MAMTEEIIKPINPAEQKTGYLKQLFQIDTPQQPVFFHAAEKAAERLTDIQKTM